MTLYLEQKILLNQIEQDLQELGRRIGNFGSRGQGDEESSYKAWFNDIKSKYPKHIHKIKFENHPEFIKNSIEKLNENQFGYSAFGLKDSWKSSPKNYFKRLQIFISRHIYK